MPASPAISMRGRNAASHASTPRNRTGSIDNELLPCRLSTRGTALPLHGLSTQTLPRSYREEVPFAVVFSEDPSSFLLGFFFLGLASRLGLPSAPSASSRLVDIDEILRAAARRVCS